MLKVNVKSADNKSGGSCNNSGNISTSSLARYIACCCNDETHHQLSNISYVFTEHYACNTTQSHSVQHPAGDCVVNEPMQRQFNDLSEMEASYTNTTLGQEKLLQDTEEFQRVSAVPLGVINVEPMDGEQGSIEEQTFVQFDRNEVVDDMGISEMVEVELPYLYPAGDGSNISEKLSRNVEYGDTQQDAMLPESMAVVPPDGDVCHSNVVVEKIMYEMPLIKAEAAGGSADFEGDKLVQSYSSAGEVYPQDMNSVQWNVHVDSADEKSGSVHNQGDEQPVEKTSSTGRLVMEKHRTITIKDVTNRGRKKTVLPLRNRHTVASPCPVSGSALTDTIIIVSPKSQTMTPLQVQHPTLTHLLGPFVSSTPAQPVSPFNQARPNTQCSPSHISSNNLMVADIATLAQLEDGLAISGSHPAVGNLVIIENPAVEENLHSEGSAPIATPQRKVSSVRHEDVVHSPSQRKTTSVMVAPKRPSGHQTLTAVSAIDATIAPETSQREVQITSSGTTLNPETNKALKMLLSKVSHEQQPEINVVGVVVNSCSDIGKPPETLADRYMKNWKQTGQFQCRFCPYSSVTRNYLYRHWMANHSSITPYQCHHCDLKASSRDVITRHQTLAHRSSAKGVVINSMLEQQTIDQFDQIFNPSFGRDGQSTVNSALCATDAVDAKKVKTENECSRTPVIGVVQNDGYSRLPIVEVRILTDNVDRPTSVICSAPTSVVTLSCVSSDTQIVKSECCPSFTNTVQCEPVSHLSNTEHPSFDIEHTNVVSCELSDISTNTEVTQDTHLTPGDTNTDADAITGVMSGQSSTTLGPKPEHLQEQMMAALHSHSDP